MNPVRARIVAAPEQYAWSSYLATAGKAKQHPSLTVDWVLGRFSGTQGRHALFQGTVQPTSILWLDIIILFGAL